ncbi:hypothetical protein C5B42_00780, partial [Candidatus Cerribacteria bacterium 'Amazon FNV 2010 28 9']
MKHAFLFKLILLLAIVLRVWSLIHFFPPSLTWDETAIGYNAFGIITVHRDEWLKRFPLVFQSFGDYKEPLAIYTTAIFEVFFGQTALAVRFPTFIAGVMLVVASYFLAPEIFTGKKEGKRIALFVMFLTAISPWALHFSMIAFESMIATALAAWGAVFLCWGRRKQTWLLVSAVCYGLSLYTYHSAKIVVPLSILLFLFVYRKEFQKLWKSVVKFFVVLLIVCLPLLYVSVFGKANDRLSGSSFVFDAQGKLKAVQEIVPTFISHYMVHFSPSYLLLGGENTYRQSNMKDGILSPLEAMLIVIALVSMVVDKKRRAFWPLIAFILISVIPATLGNDVPHANRGLMGLPWMQL